MKSAHVLKLILEKQGRSQRSLALELGVSPQTFGSRLDGTTKSMRVSTLAETLNLLGYKIVVVPEKDPVCGFELES